MSTLLSQVSENLSFVLTCLALVVGLALLAKLAEHFLPECRKVTPARRVSIIGICAALAAVLHMLDFPLPFLAPGFYKLDFSELPVLLCGFYLGPCATVICEGVKILLKLLLKGTSTASIWYHLHKSRHSAVIGLVLGTVCMSVFGTAFNAVYLLPKFAQLYGMPLDAILAMGTAIHPGVNSVTTFVVLCVAPLNIVKGAVVSLLTLLLYKRVARPLFGLHS